MSFAIEWVYSREGDLRAFADRLAEQFRVRSLPIEFQGRERVDWNHPMRSPVRPITNGFEASAALERYLVQTEAPTVDRADIEVESRDRLPRSPISATLAVGETFSVGAVEQFRMVPDLRFVSLSTDYSGFDAASSLLIGIWFRQVTAIFSGVGGLLIGIGHDEREPFPYPFGIDLTTHVDENLGRFGAVAASILPLRVRQALEDIPRIAVRRMKPDTVAIFDKYRVPFFDEADGLVSYYYPDPFPVSEAFGIWRMARARMGNAEGA